MVRERSVTLQPGREHFLEMAGFMVTTDQQAEGLDVKYRYTRLVFKIPTPNILYPLETAIQEMRDSWSSTTSTLMPVVSLNAR